MLWGLAKGKISLSLSESTNWISLPSSDVLSQKINVLNKLVYLYLSVKFGKTVQKASRPHIMYLGKADSYMHPHTI